MERCKKKKNKKNKGILSCVFFLHRIEMQKEKSELLETVGHGGREGRNLHGSRYEGRVRKEPFENGTTLNSEFKVLTLCLNSSSAYRQSCEARQGRPI